MNYFTKHETNFFKGIAILMIVIHNYLHLIPGFGLENEAGFNPNNVRRFWEFIMPFHWHESLSAIAGYIGHYGVQVFIFFSAYGLSIQVQKEAKKQTYFQYLWPRLKKLYFLLFFGIAVFLAIHFFSFGQFYEIERTLKETLMLVTSVGNFRNSTLYNNFSGPFWFFGLMVQLYLIFPLVYKLVKKINIYLIFSVFFIMISILYYVDRKYDFSIMGTVFGHLPEVLLGIYFAQKGLTKPNVLLFISCIFLFVASQFYGTLFPFSFLTITIILLYLVETLKPFINNFFPKTLIYIGEISMILFVVNGPLRLVPFFNLTNFELRAERVFLFLIVLFILSHFLYKVYCYISVKLQI